MRARGRIGRVLRVASFFVAIGVVSTGWFSTRARAEVVRDGRRLGQDLAPLADLLEGRHRIALNGEELSLVNVTTDEPVPAVLDRFSASCREQGGPIGDLFAEVGRAEQEAGGAHAGAHATASSWADGLSIVRDEEDGEGVVLCLAGSRGGSFGAALGAFAKTSDLGALGRLRYVFARPDGAGRTRAMILWTDGPFRLDRLLSEAEGRLAEDVRSAPRPPESRFLFDARIRETAYGVRVYRSKTNIGPIMNFYDSKMKSEGWDVVRMPVENGETRGYSKEGVQIVIGATREESTGDALVAVAELGSVR